VLPGFSIVLLGIFHFDRHPWPISETRHLIPDEPLTSSCNSFSSLVNRKSNMGSPLSGNRTRSYDEFFTKSHQESRDSFEASRPIPLRRGHVSTRGLVFYEGLINMSLKER